MSGIIHNLSMLLSLGLIYHLLTRQWPAANTTRHCLVGVAFGASAVLAMLTAMPVAKGIVIDGRTIVIFLAALFGGSFGGAIAMAMSALCRFILGGQGMLTGIITILLAGCGGLVARSWCKQRGWPPSMVHVWLFSLLVHLVAISAVLLLPNMPDNRFPTVITWSFLGLFPIVTTLLAIVMRDQEHWHSRFQRLEYSDWLFSQAQQLTHFGCWEYLVGKDLLFGTEEAFRIQGLPTGTQHHALKNTLRLVHPGYRTRLRKLFTRAISDGQAFDIEVPMTIRGGDEIWVRVVGQPLSSRGRMTRVVGNLFDISWRKTAELALRASERRLQAILDYAPALIAICDQRGRVVVANQQFERLAAGPLRPGYSLFEGSPNQQVADSWHTSQATLKTGEALICEETHEHRDGTLHTYLTTRFSLCKEDCEEIRKDQDGALRTNLANRFPLCKEDCGDFSIGMIATDISDRKQGEIEREQLLARLEKKNAELERFTYTVSHDLRAPLVTILGFLELLSRDLADGDLASVAEDASNIRQAATQMRELLNALLELSKAGRATGPFEKVALNRVVEDALLMLDGSIRGEDVRVRVAADLPEVAGDVVRLRQAMQNLIENALKFRCDAGAEIVIDWKPFSAEHVVVSVKDNGQGVAVDNLEKIFNLFEHGASRAAGTGIGLALVLRIMELHGGLVWASSKGLGQGCCINLLFPIPAQAPCQVLQEADQPASAAVPMIASAPTSCQGMTALSRENLLKWLP